MFLLCHTTEVGNRFDTRATRVRPHTNYPECLNKNAVHKLYSVLRASERAPGWVGKIILEDETLFTFS